MKVPVLGIKKVPLSINPESSLVVDIMGNHDLCTGKANGRSGLNNDPLAVADWTSANSI